MVDPLESFREQDEEEGNADASPTFARSLLVFCYGEQLVGVPAERVDAIIGWRQPVMLPASSPLIAGVIQDRGRVVAVLHTPAGGASDGRSTDPKRIVVCRTRRGHLGLPATETRGVGTVDLASDVGSGETVDSSEGTLVFLDPVELLGLVLSPPEVRNE